MICSGVHPVASAMVVISCSVVMFKSIAPVLFLPFAASMRLYLFFHIYVFSVFIRVWRFKAWLVRLRYHLLAHVVKRSWFFSHHTCTRNGSCYLHHLGKNDVGLLILVLVGCFPKVVMSHQLPLGFHRISSGISRQVCVLRPAALSTRLALISICARCKANHLLSRFDILLICISHRQVPYVVAHFHYVAQLLCWLLLVNVPCSCFVCWLF